MFYSTTGIIYKLRRQGGRRWWEWAQTTPDTSFGPCQWASFFRSFFLYYSIDLLIISKLNFFVSGSGSALARPWGGRVKGQQKWAGPGPARPLDSVHRTLQTRIALLTEYWVWSSSVWIYYICLYIVTCMLGFKLSYYVMFRTHL